MVTKTVRGSAATRVPLLVKVAPLTDGFLCLSPERREEGFLEKRTFTDTTFTQGQVGLWTKADSVTAFDNLEVIPK
jgi:hypothetical protein